MAIRIHKLKYIYLENFRKGCIIYNIVYKRLSRITLLSIQGTTNKVVKVKLLNSQKFFEFDIRKGSTLSFAHVEKHILDFKNIV